MLDEDPAKRPTDLNELAASLRPSATPASQVRNDATATAAREESKRRHRPLKWVLLIVCAAVLTTAGVFGWMFLSRNDKPAQSVPTPDPIENAFAIPESVK